MNGTPLARRLVLGLFGNEWVARAARRYGLRLGAGRFIAGETKLDALAAIQQLNARGSLATVDYLGENVSDAGEAAGNVAAYLAVLPAIAQAGLQANVSIKLTALGLALNPTLAATHTERIVARAAEFGNFVRIDMEDSPFTDATLDLYQNLRQRYENVGVVIQAYLRRSPRDLADLAPLAANVRLVKGAYLEPPEIAYPDKADVDRAFKELIRMRLTSGLYTAVATHDEDAIAFTTELVAARGVPRDRFEFQMLYGIRSALQEDLARRGYRVRCYVPYGTHWYPYFVRRLAERPANIGFVLRNLIRR